MPEYQWDPDEWEAFLKAESKALDDFEKARAIQLEILDDE